ncbi:MAG TPA: hypothetical protein DDY91_21325 [Planctomycetaceae bacterium]|nr:hypothetical protein [Planctomycetaceae bacterium]
MGFLEGQGLAWAMRRPAVDGILAGMGLFFAPYISHNTHWQSRSHQRGVGGGFRQPCAFCQVRRCVGLFPGK